MRTFFPLLLLVALSHVLTAQTGKPFYPPNATLLTLDSVVVNANDIIQPGQLTMVVMWNSMMRPAIKQLDSLHEVYTEWQEKYGVEIIAVTWEYPGKPENLGRFLAKRNWRYTIYRDPLTNFGGASGVRSLPHTYFFDKQGNIVHETSGYDAPEMAKYEEKLRELSGM